VWGGQLTLISKLTTLESNGSTGRPARLMRYGGPIQFQCFFTVSATGTECDGLPAASVPVTVMVEVPNGVEVEVAIVSVELPEPLIDAGLKLAVAPAGKPLTLRFTLSANPLEELTVMVEVPVLPRPTLIELGDAEMLKSG
jgi:hypothetical protein